jgi:hypothetical protein
MPKYLKRVPAGKTTLALKPPSRMVTVAQPTTFALAIIVMMEVGVHATWSEQRLAYLCLSEIRKGLSGRKLYFSPKKRSGATQCLGSTPHRQREPGLL